MRDIHIHTEFSCDSEAKMEDYILEAKKKGITTICFTDHVAELAGSIKNSSGGRL